jgi:hypothetical protein
MEIEHTQEDSHCWVSGAGAWRLQTTTQAAPRRLTRDAVRCSGEAGRRCKPHCTHHEMMPRSRQKKHNTTHVYTCIHRAHTRTATQCNRDTSLHTRTWSKLSQSGCIGGQLVRGHRQRRQRRCTARRRDRCQVVRLAVGTVHHRLRCQLQWRQQQRMLVSTRR